MPLNHHGTRLALPGWLRFPLCLLLLVSCDAALSAQRVEGTLLDAESRAPIGGATVLLLSEGGDTVHRAVSDARGGFALRAPAPAVYRLRASRVGYLEGLSQPLSLAATGVVLVELRMSTSTVVLEPVTVIGIPRYRQLEEAGFYEREQRFGPEGLGEAVFLEQHEIERTNPFEVPDIFRDVRGVLVRNRTIKMRSGCQPAIVINGITVLRGSVPGRPRTSPLPPLATGEIASPRSLAGVEVYYGTAIPSRYLIDSGGCGVIMYWTK